jgi:hypothetical protein
MIDQKKITRKDFIASMGGIAAAVVFLKLHGVKPLLNSLSAPKASDNAYGHSSYGNKNNAA